MAMDPRESQYFPTNKNCPKITSSRQWSTYKNNPRIVRASRALGGKDRHSKVFTLRGLRDRRIRLSETTAIQVYDLQHRLGFGQPSKVVDWLMDAVKEEIDKLPPLPIVPRFHQPNEPSYSSTHQEDNTTAMTNDQDYCQGLVGFEPQNYFTCQSLVNHNLQLWDRSRNLSSSQFGRGISLSRQVEVDHHRGLAMASSNDNVVSHDTMMPSSFPSCNIINQTLMDSNDPSRHLITPLMMRTFGFDVNINRSQASDTYKDLKKSTELMMILGV